MLAGIFLFAVNDALGKWLVATYSVGQVLLIRSPAALVAARAVHLARPARAFARRRGRACRCCASLLATVEVACFYWAVAYLPLADVMTFYLAGPIYVTAIAGAVAAASRSAGGAGARCWSASSA